jgi:Uma2 family endonuclease
MVSIKSKSAALEKLISIEEYFRLEEKSLTKNEYHNGILLKMAGAKLKHNLLAQAASAVLFNHVKTKRLNFMVSNSDTKIYIERVNKVVYPDAVVISRPPLFYKKRKDTIVNPYLIVEVLSDSTEKHDRNGKFEWYRSIPSFQEYVLIYQDTKQIVVWTKQTDGTWILRDYIGENAVAFLHTLEGCTMLLGDVYPDEADFQEDL